jgi:hypothetical protein
MEASEITLTAPREFRDCLAGGGTIRYARVIPKQPCLRLPLRMAGFIERDIAS